MTHTLVPQTPPRVLLVDDDPLLRHLLRHRLDGLQVTTAPDLAHARALLDSEHFDCVVLDMGLPDGEGFELLDGVEGTATPPIVVLTGRAAVPWPANRPRPAQVVQKSALDIDVLRAAVEQALPAPTVRPAAPMPGAAQVAADGPGDVRVQVSPIVTLCGGRRAGIEIRVVPDGNQQLRLPRRFAQAGTPRGAARLDRALVDIRLRALQLTPAEGLVCMPVLLESMTDPAFLAHLQAGCMALPEGSAPVVCGWGAVRVDRLDRVREAAATLRRAGIQVGVSQVGRGRTALEPLIALRPSLLRLDARLTESLVDHADDVMSIADLGRSWGARVVVPRLDPSEARLAAALGATHAVFRREPRT